MRKILIALPCLLVSGVVLAKEAPKAAEAAPTQAAKATNAGDSKRFLMTQNGKQMTADDFDAWMKKNGYRVAKGAPAKPAEPAKDSGSK